MLSPCTKSALDDSAPFTAPMWVFAWTHKCVVSSAKPSLALFMASPWGFHGPLLPPETGVSGPRLLQEGPPFFPFLPGAQDGHLLQLLVSYYMFLFYYFTLFPALGHQYLFKYWELLDRLTPDRDCVIETPFPENASPGFWKGICIDIKDFHPFVRQLTVYCFAEK